MKCAINYAQRIKNAELSGRDLLYFLDAGTAAYLRKNYGYGQKVLLRFLNEAYDGLIDDMEYYSADDENARDQMGNAYYGCTGRLKYDKIKLEEWENDILSKHTYTVYYARRNGRTLRENKMDFVQHAWLVAITYFARVIEWLHVDQHFGPTRCERVYRALRAMYDEYIDHYLLCTEKGEAYCKKMLEEATAVLESLSVEISHRYDEVKK